jgi:hypothetical protein
VAGGGGVAAELLLACPLEGFLAAHHSHARRRCSTKKSFHT